MVKNGRSGGMEYGYVRETIYSFFRFSSRLSRLYRRGRRKMYARMCAQTFVHQVLCKNCHWTSVTSINTGCVRDG